MLVLANFTYEPIRQLDIALPVKRRVQSVHSVPQGNLRFAEEGGEAEEIYRWKIKCRVNLGLTDVLLFE